MIDPADWDDEARFQHRESNKAGFYNLRYNVTPGEAWQGGPACEPVFQTFTQTANTVVLDDKCHNYAYGWTITAPIRVPARPAPKPPETPLDLGGFAGAS